MRPLSLLACSVALSLSALSLPGGVARADHFPVIDGSPQTLAQALGALPPPTHDLFVTVGADRIFLPPNAPPPDPDSGAGQMGDARQVADAYGRLIRDFGGLTAFGPPTMTVLNTRPGDPRPFDGLPPAEALKLLLAGLAPPQWALLTGPAGLGLSDLSGDGPRALFEAVLPSGDVSAYPQTDGPPRGPQPPALTLTPQALRGARLSLGRRTVLFLPIEGSTSGAVSGSTAPLPGGIIYNAVALGPPPAGDKMVYGAVLRETLPNNPKDSDLDYDAPALARVVRLEGVATVGDLVARVGRSAGLELYADRRYEARTVTLVGRRTARGKDLLRAAAFCVAGTFRRVGPAYVLTDDREGVAPRRERLRRFVEAAEMARHEAVAAAGDSLLTAHGGLDAIPSLDGLGPSAAQWARPLYSGGAADSQTRLSFAQLSPAQQERARVQMQEANAEADRSDQANGGHADRVALNGTLVLSVSPCLFLRVPAVPGPITLQSLDTNHLFQPSAKVQYQMDKKAAEDAARQGGLRHWPSPAPPAVKRALAPFARRAVLAAPRTVAELDSVLASMKALGLNQLWLEVFSGGHSVLDNGPEPTPGSFLADPSPGGKGEELGRKGEDTTFSSLSLPTPPAPLGKGAGGLGSPPDILTEALARTKGTGIAVLPAVDLLRWGADAPADALDRTALGETSAEAAAWRQRYLNATRGDLPLPFIAPPSPTVWACPAAPAAEATLLALVRRLAAMPGVGTLALRGTVPPGYDSPPGSSSGMEDDDLGYVPPLRLAFLRRAHADPLDLQTEAVLPDKTDLSLPGFDDDALTGKVFSEWNTFREDADRGLLPRLLAAAQEVRPFRFLVVERSRYSIQDWYGLWDSPQAPLPEVPPALWHSPSGPNFVKIAHTQSRIALTLLSSWTLMSPSTTGGVLRQQKPGWDGVVLDLTAPPQGRSETDLLATLAGRPPGPQ